MRKALSQPAEGPKNQYWFSLTAVGAVGSPDDTALLNDLANFCPPASPTLSSFAREPKLDAVYERVINSLVGPSREYPPAYNQAKLVLMTDKNKPTEKYQSYKKYQEAHFEAWQKLLAATTAEEKRVAQNKLSLNDKDWLLFGHRAEIDKAWNIINAAEYRMSDIRQERRRNLLEGYRNAGISGKDSVAGGFKAPVSEFSPGPADWSKPEGWTKVSYSSVDQVKLYSKETSQKQGFGGLNLGFIKIGAAGGGGKVTESKVNSVSKLSYGFELKRVLIRRAWLDTEVFFEAKDWTWRTNENTKEFPRVAIAKQAEDWLPRESPSNLYDNKQVGFALLPVELIIAKSLKIEATVSIQDFKSIEDAKEVKGVVGLFGVFGGGGGGKWTTKKENQTDKDVTFSIEVTGPVVIGMISQILPVCPDPDPKQKWPLDAWLPK